MLRFENWEYPVLFLQDDTGDERGSKHLPERELALACYFCYQLHCPEPEDFRLHKNARGAGALLHVDNVTMVFWHVSEYNSSRKLVWDSLGQVGQRDKAFWVTFGEFQAETSTRPPSETPTEAGCRRRSNCRRSFHKPVEAGAELPELLDSGSHDVEEGCFLQLDWKEWRTLCSKAFIKVFSSFASKATNK